MFTPDNITKLIVDIFRTEMAKGRTDALALFETPDTFNWSTLPARVREQGLKQVGLFFGFTPTVGGTLPELVEQALGAYKKNQFIYLSTSGSTGFPQFFKYTAQMLQQEGREVGKHFKQAGRFITLTPLQHLYGLSFGILFPSVYHIPTTALAPLPLQPWRTLWQAGDVVAGFPLFWEYFLKAGNRFPPGVIAVTSTAPCPKGLFAHLKEAGAARVVELYGASETGGIGVREAEEAPFEVNTFWQISTNSCPPKIHREGIDGWVDFPDEIRFVSPRGVFPLKRTDSAVRVAGINVFPKQIEQVILQHPAVKACQVRLMRPEEGCRLKAFLVLKEGFSENILPVLRAEISTKLSNHQIPRSFTIGKELPKNMMGKDSDW